jgi:hypothetical protein
VTIRDLLKDHPEAIDYSICFSEFLIIDKDNNVEVISDFPVLGIGSSDDTKELRFLLTVDDWEVFKKSRMKIIHIVDEKITEMNENDNE